VTVTASWFALVPVVGAADLVVAVAAVVAVAVTNVLRVADAALLLVVDQVSFLKGMNENVGALSFRMTVTTDYGCRVQTPSGGVIKNYNCRQE
jgi:hypothetical protein